MSQLTFTKVDDLYEAETTVNADFNLHIERNKSEVIAVDITTVTTGSYQCAYLNYEGEVFDQDFQALVYPKKIRIRTRSKPIEGKCYVTEVS